MLTKDVPQNLCDCTQPRIQLEYLFEDKPMMPGAPLSHYAGLDFVSHGCHLYGEILWPDGSFSIPRPCVIMLHGFPGCARNDDIAHALCRTGCVVLTPHHRGAWGSEGEYLVTNCIEDAAALAAHVRSPAFRGEYNIDPDAIYLVGHSMGGNTALHAARRLPWLRGIVLMTPYDPTRHIRSDSSDRLLALSDEATSLHWGGKEIVFQNILDHLNELMYENAADEVCDRNLLCVTGSADDIAPGGDMFEPLWTRLQAHKTDVVRRWIELPADHGLLGCRCTLIRHIAQFIRDTLSN